MQQTWMSDSPSLEIRTGQSAREDDPISFTRVTKQFCAGLGGPSQDSRVGTQTSVVGAVRYSEIVPVGLGCSPLGDRGRAAK